MRGRRPTAGPLVVLAVTASCAVRPVGAPSRAQAGEEDASLDVSVDRVDIVHGALRVSASMDDGSADLAISTGDECERRDIGGGVATSSTFVWTFAAGELADALRCSLRVRARLTTALGGVTSVASLPVEATLTPVDLDLAPRLMELSRSHGAMELSVAFVSRNERLSVGDSLISSEWIQRDDQPVAVFSFSQEDFARAVLSFRPLRLGGASFDASVTVGGTSLEAEEP